MNTRLINGILIVLIVVVMGAFAFLGVRFWQDGRQQTGELQPDQQKLVAEPLRNEGQISVERDALTESDMRAMSDAVAAYAKDHQGRYPEPDRRNPCNGVQICLKGVDINTQEKAYLPVVPQSPQYRLDYYYSADNKQKTYCIAAPYVFETDQGNTFRCTQAGCGRVAAGQGCQ